MTEGRFLAGGLYPLAQADSVKPAPITVKRPNPATGEVVERVVPADTFTPKLPREPVLDPTRITLVQRDTGSGPTGRSVVYMLTHREEQVDYWQAHAHCLTKEERAKLARGETTSITRPIAPAWESGQLVDVAEGVEARVFSMEETRTAHRTVFRVIDYRPDLLKRSAGYTRSVALAVPEAGLVMDDKLHARLHAEASMANAMRSGRKKARTTKLRLEDRLEEARKKNRRGTVRYLERQLMCVERKSGGAA